MREEERQAQRAAARAERRTRRAAEQAAQNVPQKTEAPKAPQKAGVPHKKKINKFRVAVVCTAAVLVAHPSAVSPQTANRSSSPP